MIQEVTGLFHLVHKNMKWGKKLNRMYRKIAFFFLVFLCSWITWLVVRRLFEMVSAVMFGCPQPWPWDPACFRAAFGKGWAARWRGTCAERSFAIPCFLLFVWRWIWGSLQREAEAAGKAWVSGGHQNAEGGLHGKTEARFFGRSEHHGAVWPPQHHPLGRRCHKK